MSARSITDRETRQIMLAYEAKGFTFVRLGSGHYAIEFEGERISVFSGTRCGHRERKNTISRIKQFERKRKEKADGESL